jgi:hypothetical protein
VTLQRATYIELPIHQRKLSAMAARARYQAALADPTLSRELRDQYSELLRRIAKWEAGTLPVKST